MDTPDGTYVVGRAPRFDWAGAGYANGPSLDEEVGDAVEYVEGVTWRKLDATMPAAYARRAARAVVMRTQQQVTQADPDAVESAADELTSNQGAGGASESRRAFSDYKSANEALLVNRWPALNDLLWGVMTPDAQAWWRAFLKGEMPAVPSGYLEGGFNVTEVAWDLVHADPYSDVAPGYHSTYLAPVDPGDLPLVQDPYGDPY
jgi:hypothetical protein